MAVKRKGEKLGDLVRPFFESVGAKIEYGKHGPGTVTYTTTQEQLRKAFEHSPFEYATVSLTKLAKKLKKRKRTKP